MKSTTARLVFFLTVGLLLFGSALAGTLDPPGPPAPTMVTLQQINDRAHPVDTCFDNGGRFADCGNGTVKDTVTGLIWLKNANCFGQKDWAAANIAAAQLANGQCGLTDASAAGSWRLPTKTEWQAIVKTACSNPALPDRVGLGCYAANPWATGVQSWKYWSSTTYANLPSLAWLVSLGLPDVYSFDKTATFYVWPVRGGQ